MTSLPASPPSKRLGLVIDLDTCVGCHACVVSCKEWNTGGYPAPLSDQDPYGAAPLGAWLAVRKEFGPGWELPAALGAGVPFVQPRHGAFPGATTAAADRAPGG